MLVPVRILRVCALPRQATGSYSARLDTGTEIVRFDSPHPYSPRMATTDRRQCRPTAIPRQHPTYHRRDSEHGTNQKSAQKYAAQQPPTASKYYLLLRCTSSTHQPDSPATGCWPADSPLQSRTPPTIPTAELVVPCTVDRASWGAPAGGHQCARTSALRPERSVCPMPSSPCVSVGRCESPERCGRRELSPGVPARAPPLYPFPPKLGIQKCPDFAPKQANQVHTKCPDMCLFSILGVAGSV